MNGLFLVQNLQSPATRYRVLQYLPYFEQRGVNAVVREVPRSRVQRWRLFRSARNYDFVFLQRKRSGPLLTRCLRRNARVLVFDFDDAIMFRSGRNAEAQSSGRSRQFLRTVQSADAVFCGNRFLAETTADHNPNTLVVPTSIDVARYPLKQYTQRKAVTLGWIGSQSTLRYLEGLRPVFEEIGAVRRDIELKIVCDRFFDLERMPVRKVRWSSETEVAEVQSFDIGLMPLEMDVWSRGKCGLKILQCLAAGVPVVATPVGVNRDLVEEGVTGLRAATPAEWVEKLLRLADDPSGREQMGRTGRQRVVESYSLEGTAAALCDRIQTLVATRTVAR